MNRPPVDANDTHIADLSADRPDLIEQTATVLYEAFRTRSAAWPSLAAAREEVRASLEPGRISRVMVDRDGRVIGWIGGISPYDGFVWELHPLVVADGHRRQGIGRMLVQNLERLVETRGALTLWAGSDDEQYETTLGGADLYADLPAAIRDVRNLRQHPYEFYLRLGFSIVGVMPDANGRGKPDIYLAKRVGA
jgi:aminoglycoside 6'-N-acetyltransferase I